MKNILIIGSRGKLGVALTNQYSRTFNVIKVDSRDIDHGEQVDLIEYILEKIKSNSIKKIDVILFAHRYKSRNDDVSKLKIGDFKVLENEVSTTINIIESLFKNDLIASGGKIILFGSTNDSLISQQSLYYHIAKSSIKIMVKWLAERMMPHNVSVNGVSMGLITDAEDAKNNEMQSVIRVAKNLNINKRPTSFQEVSEFVYSVTNLSSNQLTGETILMDGGFSLSDGYYMFTKKFNEEE
jgi:enoyl-[acyl-carrier-protein] reductase (NADH)